MANAKQNHWLNIRGPRLFYNSANVGNIEKLLESSWCSQKNVGAAGGCTIGEPNESVRGHRLSASSPYVPSMTCIVGHYVLARHDNVV